MTERKEVADQIALLAQTDALTGLANRRSFIDALRRAFAHAEAGGKPFALLYIDVDHFKEVNDRLGHASGDALLEALAARLKGHCRAGDVVARLGGDEFAILQSKARDEASAAAMAAKICALAATPYALPGGELLRHCQRRRRSVRLEDGGARPDAGARRPRALSRQGERQKPISHRLRRGDMRPTVGHKCRTSIFCRSCHRSASVTG